MKELVGYVVDSFGSGEGIVVVFVGKDLDVGIEEILEESVDILEDYVGSFVGDVFGGYKVVLEVEGGG